MGTWRIGTDKYVADRYRDQPKKGDKVWVEGRRNRDGSGQFAQDGYVELVLKDSEQIWVKFINDIEREFYDWADFANIGTGETVWGKYEEHTRLECCRDCLTHPITF